MMFVQPIAANIPRAVRRAGFQPAMKKLSLAGKMPALRAQRLLLAGKMALVRRAGFQPAMTKLLLAGKMPALRAQQLSLAGKMPALRAIKGDAGDTAR